MTQFRLVSKYSPCGDQPAAIEKLAAGLENGFSTEVLLGVTGSGKTFTMANVIEKLQRPALVIAHNKTLAAQLCNEFREFFPHNRVEFFVSYYDYYQPEAYIPRSDTYIEKELEINDEIDKLRHSATASLCERRDVIVVSSVSCIYGLGAPVDYYAQAVSIREGDDIEQDELIRRLVDIQYKRADFDFVRSTFRVRGDTLDIFPAGNSEIAIRVEFFGDEIDRISEFTPVNGQVTRMLQHIAIYPASHYVTTKDKLERAIVEIDRELDEREHLVDLLLDLVARQLLLAQRKRHVFEHVQFVDQVERLEDHADMRAIFRGVDAFTGDIFAVVENIAARWRFQQIHAAQQRRFAGAGRADDGDHVAFFDIKVDIAQDFVRAKGLAQVLDLKNIVCHISDPPCCVRI